MPVDLEIPPADEPLTHASLGALHTLTGTLSLTPSRSFCGNEGPIAVDSGSMTRVALGLTTLRAVRSLVTCPRCRRPLSQAVGAAEGWTLYLVEGTR